MAELRGRRELFAREYLARNLHGANAALAAGYSADRARVTASELLAEPEVQDRIAELATARNQRLEIKADEVLLELRRMLHADVSLLYDENGNIKPIADIPIDLRRTIASVEVDELWAGRGEDRQQIGVTKKVKFWSKEKAAELLGKHLKLWLDRLELTPGGDFIEALRAARNRTDPLV